MRIFSGQAARRRATASDQPGAFSSSVPGETQLLESSESPSARPHSRPGYRSHRCMRVHARPMRIFRGGGAAAHDGFGPARGVLLFGPRREAAAGVVGVASRRRARRAPRHARLSARRHAPALAVPTSMAPPGVSRHSCEHLEVSVRAAHPYSPGGGSRRRREHVNGTQGVRSNSCSNSSAARRGHALRCHAWIESQYNTCWVLWGGLGYQYITYSAIDGVVSR